jgi:hypothetical protein
MKRGVLEKNQDSSFLFFHEEPQEKSFHIQLFSQRPKSGLKSSAWNPQAAAAERV